MSNESSPSFQLVCRRFRKCKQARLKITRHALTLELPLALSDELETRYRQIAASLLKKCVEQGIPGTLYGRFSAKYDAITLQHCGRPYMEYWDKDAFEKDRQEMKRILAESFEQTVRDQNLVVPAEFDLSGFGDEPLLSQ